MAAKKKKAKRGASARQAKKAPARKAKKAGARKAKKSAKKASKRPAQRAAKKTAKRPAKKASKAAAKKAPARKASAKKKKQTVGEGDYAASRAFLKDQAGFVEKNKGKIPEMGREAADALEGPEGDTLRSAEADAADRSRDMP
jgi:hypothetical protein